MAIKERTFEVVSAEGNPMIEWLANQIVKKLEEEEINNEKQ